ncbi:MAG: amidase family protein, partial [Trueperaceae bacterium]
LHARCNAFVEILHDQARSAADVVDAARERGEALPPLAGVPVAVKANLCVAGVRTTAGSAILRDHRPPYDATVVRRLREAGAIVVATTNLDEFGMGGSSETSWHGPVRHPADPERVPGGSSGGSAAAVAGGVVPVALGTDTGGSVRQPAAFCGVLGFKPAYGTLSRWGVIAYGSSLDQVGVLAHHAEDVAAFVDAMAGPDPHDATCAGAPYGADPESRLARALADAPPDLRGVRIGVIEELAGDGNDPAVRAGLQRLLDAAREAGASVAEVEVPDARAGVACYHLIAATEAASNLARYDGAITGVRVGDEAEGQEAVTTASRGAGFGDEVQRRVLMGTFAASAGHVDAWYLAASRVRRKLADQIAAAFHEVDLLLTPTAPTVAYRLGDRTDDPLAMALGDVDTCLANLAGVGAISVPAGSDPDGLPVGVQAMATADRNDLLLRFARALRDAREPVLSSSG